MFIIVNNSTKKIVQTIDKNFGLQLRGNETLHEVSDEFMSKYNNAYDYNLSFEMESVVDIVVIRTLQEYKNNLPFSIQQPTIEERISAIEEAVLEVLSNV